EQIERQLETLTALYATAQKLSQSLDLDQLAHYVVETAVKTFGARFAWIGHAEPGGAIRRLAHWPNRDEYLRDFAPRWDESPAGQGPSGRAIRSGFPVVVDDVASDASLIRRDILVSLGLKSAGAFPLISRDKPFGVLVLHGAEDNFFGPARTEFFQAFSNQAAAALERRSLTVQSPAAEPGEFSRSVTFAQERFVAYVAIPLLAKGQIKGVLEVFHRAVLSPTPEWLAFLEALGGQAAIAIDNSTLFDNLQRANTELTMAYDTTLEGWSQALDLRDKETEGHTLRVTKLTMRLAREMGVRDSDLVQIQRGALLHDIGKMG